MSRSDATLRNRLQLLREHFREGRYGQAENMLLHLIRAPRLPREARLECANLARRAGFTVLALRFLHPQVFGRLASKNPATADEKAEYAASLSILGSASESRRLFKEIDVSKAPEAAYLRAISVMAEWDFAPAIPDLEMYLKSQPSKAQLVATELRLATCYIREPSGPGDGDRAKKMIEDVIRRADTDEFRPQLIYAMHLMAEYRYTIEQDARGALKEIQELERRFPDHQAVILKIWKNLLSMKLEGEKPQYREALEADRVATIKAGDWRTLRFFDLYEAFILKKPELYKRVAFGSPYAGIRKFVARRYGSPTPALPDRYDWEPTVEAAGKGGSTKKELPVLDVLENGPEPGGQLQSLLLALVSDFYRPIPDGELHERLYPGEHFDPVRSPGRVRVLVLRLRRWLEKSKHPLRIAPSEKAYHLEARSRCVVRLPNPELKLAPAMARELRDALDVLAAKFADRAFSAPEAAKLWNVSLRAAQYRLKEGAVHGRVTTTGKGPATRYRAVNLPS